MRRRGSLALMLWVKASEWIVRAGVAHGARVPVGAEAVHVEAAGRRAGEVLLHGEERAVYAVITAARLDDSQVIILHQDAAVDGVVRNLQFDDHRVLVVGLLRVDAALGDPEGGIAATGACGARPR
jgi:hypothetical protein